MSNLNNEQLSPMAEKFLQMSNSNFTLTFNHFAMSREDILEVYKIRERFITLANQKAVAKLDELEEKHDADVVVIRRMMDQLSELQNRSFAARDKVLRLESDANNAGENIFTWKTNNYPRDNSLVTRREKIQADEKLAELKQKAEKASLAAGLAGNSYNALVFNEINPLIERIEAEKAKLQNLKLEIKIMRGEDVKGLRTSNGLLY